MTSVPKIKEYVRAICMNFSRKWYKEIDTIIWKLKSMKGTLTQNGLISTSVWIYCSLSADIWNEESWKTSVHEKPETLA